MKKYLSLQIQWMIIIEALYKWLCSFFHPDHLQCMKWYVGNSIIFDDKNNKRPKEFFINWGIDSYYMLIDYLKIQQLKDDEYLLHDTKDKKCVSNTMVQYNQDGIYDHILLYKHHYHLIQHNK